MRLGHVIGRVTLSQQDPAYKGGRFLLVQPFSREQFAGAPLLPLAKGSSLVVYDNLGAGVGRLDIGVARVGCDRRVVGAEPALDDA